MQFAGALLVIEGRPPPAARVAALAQGFKTLDKECWALQGGEETDGKVHGRTQL